MNDNTEQNVLQTGGSKGLVERVKAILVTPKTEWEVIAAETPDTGKLITGYALPLILLSGIASFIGIGLLGIGIPGISITAGIVKAIISVVTGLVSIYLSAIIINALASTFDSRSDMNRAIQLVIYAMTPSWIAGISNVIPLLGWILALFGLYSIYLFYLGLPPIMKTPKDKVIPYMLVSALIVAAVMALVAMVLGLILWPLFGLAAIGGSIF